jgi:transposase InsO family protein
MRRTGIQGIYRRKRRGCTRRDPDATPSADLVNRAFDPPEPDRLWMMDITEHPATAGCTWRWSSTLNAARADSSLPRSQVNDRRSWPGSVVIADASAFFIVMAP